MRCFMTEFVLDDTEGFLLTAAWSITSPHPNRNKSRPSPHVTTAHNFSLASCYSITVTWPHWHWLSCLVLETKHKPQISYSEIRRYSKVYPWVKFWRFSNAFYSQNNYSRDNFLLLHYLNMTKTSVRNVLQSVLTMALRLTDPSLYCTKQHCNCHCNTTTTTILLSCNRYFSFCMMHQVKPHLAFSALTLLVGQQEWHVASNKYERSCGPGKRLLAYLFYYMHTVTPPVHKYSSLRSIMHTELQQALCSIESI